jgi:hypothetical protein
MAQLPVLSLAWCALSLVWVKRFGWLDRLATREVFGRSIRLPSTASVVSGTATAVVTASILLALTAKGGSILTAIVLARSLVLLVGPVVDLSFGRRLGAHVVLAGALALAAVLLTTGGRAPSASFVIPLAVYLVAYAVRLAVLSRRAKTRDPSVNWSFFVGEHVSTACFFALLALVLLGARCLGGHAPWSTSVTISGLARVGWLLLLGMAAELVGLFSGLLYVSPQGNTFCVLASRCAGVLGSAAAGLLLSWCSRERWMSKQEAIGVALTIAAMTVLAWGDRRAQSRRRAPASECAQA